MADTKHSVSGADPRPYRPDTFRMTLRLPADAAEALRRLAPPGDRCDLIAYLLRCELVRQGLANTAPKSC